MNKDKEALKRQRRILLVAAAFFVIVIIFTTVRQSVSGRKYEDAVKNSSPVEFSESGKNYGQAFEEYFTNGSWQVFQQEDKSYIVQFRGVCDYDGRTEEALLQFMTGDASGTGVSSESDEGKITVSPIESTGGVHIIYMSLNEERLSVEEQEKFLADIFGR